MRKFTAALLFSILSVLPPAGSAGQFKEAGVRSQAPLVAAPSQLPVLPAPHAGLESSAVAPDLQQAQAGAQGAAAAAAQSQASPEAAIEGSALASIRPEAIVSPRGSLASSAAPRVSGALVRLKSAFDRLTRRGADSVVPVAAARSSVWALGRRHVRAAVLAASLSLGLAQPALLHSQTPVVAMQVQNQQARVVHAGSIDDMNAQYDSDVRVVVIGQLPAEVASQVQDLKNSLKGSHWTVVLVADSSNLSYYDQLNRRTYTDLDALDYGIGHGLMHQAAFAALKDPLTNLPDGATLYVVFSPQHMDAFGPSEAEVRAGLTKDAYSNDFHSHFADEMNNSGNVKNAILAVKTYVDSRMAQSDRDMIDGASNRIASGKSAVTELQALQAAAQGSGRRLPQAAKADVQTLNADLKKAQEAFDAKDFSGAEKLAAQAEAEAQGAVSAGRQYNQAYDAAVASFGAAKSELGSLEASAAALRKAHGGLSGDLARPDLGRMRSELSAAFGRLDVDPAAAGQAAARVQQEARDLSRAINGYDAAEKEIQETYAKHSTQTQRQRANSAAQTQLRDAKQQLDGARDAWRNGDSSYRLKLDAAKQAVGDSQKLIDEADHDAALARLWSIILGLLGALALSGFGLWLHGRVKPFRKKALEDYSAKKALIDGKNEAMQTGSAEQNAPGSFEKEVEQTIGPVGGDDAKSFDEESLKLAQQVRAHAAAMAIIGPSLEDVLEQAKAMIYPKGLGKIVNWFWPARYQRAVKRLQDEPVTFTPESGLPQLRGRKVTWQTKLYGSLAEQKPITDSFENLVVEYDAHAKAAVADLKTLHDAIYGLDDRLKETKDLAAQALGRKGAIDTAASDGLFTGSAVFTSLLPASNAAVEALKKAHARNPVGAMNSSGAEAKRMAQEASDLTQLILDARSKAVANARQNEETIKKAGISAQWIEDSFKVQSQNAETLAQKAAKGSIAEDLKTLRATIDAIANHSADAAQLADRYVKSASAVKDGAAAALAARKSLGTALGLDPEKTLVETGSNPSELLAQAEKLNASAAASLAKGENASAQSALQKAEELTHQVGVIIADSQAALKAQAQTVSDRQADMTRIEGSVRPHELILNDIRKRYAASVLNLRAGDPGHPDANGTIDDNIDEANEHLAQAKDKLAASAKAYKAGRLLEAADLLRQVHGHQDLASYRLGEIAEKKARLEKTQASNQTLLEQLEGISKQDEASVLGDSRAMKPTMQAYQQITRDLSVAQDQVEQAKGDPFIAEQSLLKVKDELERLAVQANNDRDLYNHAGTVVESARQAVERAKAEAREVDGDGVAPSQKVRQAEQQLAALARAYDQVKAAYGTAHNDWHAVDQEAGRIAQEAAHVTADLKNELEHAQRATAAIENAGSKVRSATTWTGRYGVSIPGSPGSGDLQRARDLLSQGRYDEAAAEAESAMHAAAMAIAAAEAEVQRRYAAEQERLAEERRERERREEEARQRSSGGGMGGGGGWSGSSGSGMGRGGGW